MYKRVCFSLIALLVLCFQAACGAAPTAPPAPPPAAAPTVAPLVQPTVAQPVAEATATVASAAPPVLAMEVGTTFSYFDGSLLVPVPAGPFIMGAGGPDNPIHTVYLSDFWIYTTEVTNRMYSLCVAAGKCSPPDPADNPMFTDTRGGNRPVVGVKWQQAADYCDFAHGRLPTEAEWEKAARGPNGKIRPWGDAPPTCDLLNFGSCVFQTTDVGAYPKGASDYGALDLAGNVFEWAHDVYLASYYGAAPTQDPLGPDTGSKRSVRSSSFNTDGYLTEVARRFSALPDETRADLGFRCVVEDPTYFAPFCTTPPFYGRVPPAGQSNAQAVGPECAVITQSQVQMCVNKVSWTRVVVTATDGEIASAGALDAGCHKDPSSTPTHIVYLCEATDGVTSYNACPKCTTPSDVELSCAAGYHLVGQLCVLKQGWPGHCPEGVAYDPAQQCCTPPARIRSIYDLNCPSGFYPFVDGNSVSCFQLSSVPCQPFNVAYKTCEGHKPPCDPTTDPNCAPPCDPQTDPNCCPPGTAGCGPPPNNCNNCPTCPGCPGNPTGCLPAQTMIDTPAGPMAVEGLQVGGPVWTVDAAGRRVTASILKVGRTPVIASYAVIHLVLADGRELQASAGHPTADGRTLGDLSVGDTLDGALITLVERVPYGEPATYDLLPSGETGFYWANGILLGSTLFGP